MTDLLPNAQYELWVTATNTTGISPASEKALYMTGNKFHTPTTTRGVIKLVTVEIIVLLSQDVLSDVFFSILLSLQPHMIDVRENKV